jgi:hypothetical protein
LKDLFCSIAKLQIRRLEFDLEVARGGQVETDEEDSSLRRKWKDDKVLLGELRSRVNTQNDLIAKLRDHMAYYQRVEADWLRLKQVKVSLETTSKELQAKLDLAETLRKPVRSKIDIDLSNMFIYLIKSSVFYFNSKGK